MSPLRIGTTSFIHSADGPDPYLSNARKLVDQVDDIELQFFDLSHADELPDAEELAGLAELKQRGLTYTVRTPRESGPLWIEQTLRAIELTRPLKPELFVVRLDSTQPETQIRAMLDAGLPAERICVENLETRFASLIEQYGLAIALDIGQLLRDDQDVEGYLDRYLTGTRIIHLHGVDARGRDHRSLASFPDDLGQRLVDRLLAVRYPGVLTLSQLDEDAFEQSMAVLDGWLGVRALPGL